MKRRKKILLLCSLVTLSVACGGVSVAISGASGNDGKVTAIEIEVDTLTYASHALPYGLEGMTYPVFDCKATDNLGNAVETVEVLVYAPNGGLVPVKTGRFATETTGEYKIEYTATSGAASDTNVLTVRVVPETEYTPISYTVNANVVNEAQTGDIVYVPDGELPTGGFGDIHTEFSLKYVGVYDQDEVVIEDVGMGKRFIPQASGVYRLQYALTDIVNRVVIIEKDITVTDALKPVMQAPAVTPVCHLGETVKLPYTEAKIYKEGQILYVPVTVTVNGEDVSDSMSFAPETVGEYVVKYAAENVFAPTEKTEYEYVVKAVDMQGASKPTRIVDGYVALDNFTSSYRTRDEAQASGLEANVYLLTADGTEEQASMRFKSKIHKDYVGISFGVEPLQSNFDKVNVYFSDSVNADETIVVTFEENAEKTVDVYVNGAYVKTLTDKSFTTETKVFDNSAVSVEYDDESNALTMDEQTLATLTATADGKKFSGFSSGFVYVRMQVEGIEGTSVIKLKSIAGENISNSAKDNGKPLIIYSDDYAKNVRADKDTETTIKWLDAFDLFDENIVLNLQIVSPSKKVVVDMEMKEAYTLKLTEYGTYTILYNFKDTAGNLRQETAIVDVVDRIPPTMSEVSLPATVKVGDTITFPDATVSDNVSTSCTTWIYLKKGDYNHRQLIDATTKKYTFISEGTHVFTYCAMDATGNYVEIEYVIECK